MSLLARAICIAARAHDLQRDKGGAPYILHPLRVMLSMANDDDRVVAVLHDILEDTEWTVERLRGEGLSDTVLEAIVSLTRRPQESYDDFILRVAANEIGRRVKLADLADNSDLSRIPAPSAKDHERMVKYGDAIALLKRHQP